MESTPHYSALFVDYENVYYFLKNRLQNGLDPSDGAIQLIRRLRQTLLDEFSEQCIVQHAYADFEKIEESAQGPLYLIGVESHNVLGTEHKNAADMRLCIDALETMYTRPEINRFTFLAGDRDYIPVIQHLRKHARSVRVVAFQANMSGDLLINVGEENYLDAASLLPSEFVLAAPKPDRSSAPTEKKTYVAPPVAPVAEPSFSPPRALGDRERETLQVMIDGFGAKREIWVTPFLHRLREEMPLLAEYERRNLITNLAEAGAVAVEKRPGTPREYSVILLNWDHPAVRELCAG